MAKDITRWLENGSNYQEGVSLYDKYGTDKFLKRILKRGENSFNRKKLAEELCSILMLVPEDPASDPEPAHAELPDEPVHKAPTGIKSSEPPELLKIIGQINSNYAELRGLHPYLSIIDEGEDLRLLAVQIVKSGKRNAELWERRNYIAENGPDIVEVEPPRPPVMIDLNLLQERERIRKSLNKAENRLKKQTNPKDYTQALIDQRKQQLAEIDKVIAGIKTRKGADHE